MLIRLSAVAVAMALDAAALALYDFAVDNGYGRQEWTAMFNNVLEMN